MTTLVTREKLSPLPMRGKRTPVVTRTDCVESHTRMSVDCAVFAEAGAEHAGVVSLSSKKCLVIVL